MSLQDLRMKGICKDTKLFYIFKWISQSFQARCMVVGLGDANDKFLKESDQQVLNNAHQAGLQGSYSWTTSAWYS